MLEEFYSVAYRKDVYTTIEQPQTNVDEWLRNYNEEMPHSGRYCYGKTPMQTFREAKHLADEKILDRWLLHLILGRQACIVFTFHAFVS